jgi:hypothetical protein
VAHYGRNHSGYVIEIDEEALARSISLGYIRDIEYMTTTATIDLGLVHFAATTLKFRHTPRVQTLAFTNAYFTKNKCWDYELERRLVVNPKDITEMDGHMILYIPVDCISAIISGPKAAREEQIAHQALSIKLGCRYYHLKIGRSSCSPYFVDFQGESFEFNDATIDPLISACDSCGEPLNDSSEGLCNWCAVGEDERNDAAMKNPLRILYRFGLGDGYGFAFANLSPIGRDVRAPAKPDSTEETKDSD